MASKKKRLFLALDGDTGKLYSSVEPPTRTTPTETGCSCGTPNCILNDGQGYRGGFSDDTVYTFCNDGLRDAGIKLRDGQMVEVTLSKVAR